MIHLIHAMLLDIEGNVLAQKPCEARLSSDGTVYFEDRVDFPPVQREAEAAWVRLDQAPPGKIHVCMSVGQLMERDYSPHHMEPRDLFSILPKD